MKTPKDKIKTTIGEVEELISKVYEEFYDSLSHGEELAVDFKDYGAIFADTSLKVVVDDLNLELRNGQACNLVDGKWEPDWSATLIYEKDAAINAPTYYEQDDMVVSLHNFLTMIGKSTYVYDIPCYIFIEK